MPYGTTDDRRFHVSSINHHRTAPLIAGNVSRRLLLVGAMATAAIGVAYGPLLVEFAGWQWSRAHYQFFPFVLAAVSGLLSYRWWHAERRERVKRIAWPTVALASLSWLVLLAAIWLPSPLLAAVSLIILAAAGFREIDRRWRVEYLWGIWALLLLVLPLPLGLDRRLITFLQLASSRLSSQALDAVGVLHLIEGNTLSLHDQRLFVDEACSGIVSILSIIAAAAIVGVWWNRPPLHVILLAASGVVWATMLNVLRISLIAFVEANFGIDWSTGTSHEMLSLVLFAVAFGAVVSTDQLLLAWIAPVAERWEEWSGTELKLGRWLARAWDAAVEFGSREARDEVEEPTAPELPPPALNDPASPRGARGQPVVAWALMVAFLAVGVGQWWLVDRAMAAHDGNGPSEKVAVAVAMDKTTLPQEVAGVRLLEHRREQRETRHFFGEYSQVYEYEDAESRPVVVSCDFAFPGGWHELTVCYEAVGWELESRRRDYPHGPTPRGEQSSGRRLAVCRGGVPPP